MRVYYGKTSGKLSSFDGKKSKYVIWGDWLEVEPHPADASKNVVNWRAWDARTKKVRIDKYVVPKADCQNDALLEMIFLDVGQGDGCIVNVPNGAKQRTMIIDAGQRGNMHGFLDWRFRNVDENAKFDTAVITHPDSDHYLGFRPIFDDKRFHFRQVLHNGLVERDTPQKDDRLGKRKNGRCTELFDSKAKLKVFLADPSVRGKSLYTNLLWAVVDDDQRFGDVTMASAKTGETVGGKTYVKGYAPDGADSASIEILGPVPDRVGQSLALREFGLKPGDGKFDLGKTKNGHSVILKLCYRDFRVIFGGDLNRPSEEYLLRHYGGIGDAKPLADAIPQARQRLGADLLKCCHHGSADVTDEFLETVNPFGFVVSSGDEESHVHPRPEILGLLGKKGRGDRPLVLCTEILRSTPESKRLSAQDKAEHEKLMDAIAAAATPAEKKEARRRLSGFWNRRFARLVNVYGAINIRTDGRKLIVGFLKEKRGSGSPWQLYSYECRNGEWKGVELK
jgi:beta-lactamase superfamily II metal-dependent hydrolase